MNIQCNLFLDTQTSSSDYSFPFDEWLADNFLINETMCEYINHLSTIKRKAEMKNWKDQLKNFLS